jgi:hypothetical protein
MRKQVQLVLFTVATVALILSLMLAFTPSDRVYAGGGWQVVATNLNNPFHLDVAEDGTIYVAEAGSPPAEQSEDCVPSPFDPSQSICYGETGSVRVIEPGDPPTQTNYLVTDLPNTHIYSGTGEYLGVASGPQGISLEEGGTGVYVVNGLGADPAAREGFGEGGQNIGVLFHIMSDGSWMRVADIAGYEGTNNPDGGMLDSNPYAVHDTAAGTYVADAGGNDLLLVDAGGVITTHTVFPSRTVEFPPDSGQMVPIESVPTSITEDETGNLYVGELTGGPFPIGEARVYDVAVPGSPQVEETGFTMIGDIAYDSMGNLYVLEIFSNGEGEDPTGALIRVSPDGTHTPIVDSPCTMNPPNPNAGALCAPTGMTVGPDDMVYVVNYGLMGPLANVVRIDPNEPTAVTVTALEASPAERALRPMLALLAITATAGLMFIRRRR